MDKRREAEIANDRPIRSGQIQDPYGTPQPDAMPVRDESGPRDDGRRPDTTSDTNPLSDPAGDVKG
jgi:hypothetical protein